MSNPFLESVQNVADEELVPKAQGGDRDALERLLARHQPWILNIAVHKAIDSRRGRRRVDEK